MNIAKHMEAIFLAAASLTMVVLFATTTAPVITVNVAGPVAAHAAEMPTVVITGKRLG